jgi:hypothetical protein
MSTKTFALGRAGLALSLLLTPLSGCFDDAEPELGTDEAEAIKLPGPPPPRCFGKADADGFGRATAAGDFDADGDIDLAVAAPSDNDYRNGATGAVYVYRREGTSLVPWTRISPTLLQIGATLSTRMADTLVAGDFDDDGKAELAFQVTGPDPAGIFPGRVIVVGADDANASFVVQQILSQAGLGTDEGGDRFGLHLATGDFDADGAADLVAAAPYDDEGTPDWDGRVYVFRGGGAQLAPWKVLTPQTLLLLDAGFGDAIAVGDFDNNGYDDLAVGMPNQNIYGNPYAQGTVVTYRSTAGNPLAPARLLEGRLYVSPSGTTRAHFGASLAALDMDGDGDDELAVGAPDARYGSSDLGAGAVKIFRNAVGTPSLWHTLQMPFPSAHQGKGLAAGDFNGNGAEDLAVEQDRYADMGELLVWKGRVGTTPVLGDTYDESVAAIDAEDLDGDGKADLIVGQTTAAGPLVYGLGRTTYMPLLDRTLYQQQPGCVTYWGAAPVITSRGARQRELDLRITASGTVDQTFWFRQSGGGPTWYEYATVGDRTDTGLTAGSQYCYYGRTLQVGSHAYSDPTTACFSTAAPINGPSISLTARTKTSLSVRMVAGSGADRIRSQLQSNASSSQTTTGTTIDRTFSSLSAGTQYCVVADAFHPSTSEWSQPRTQCFSTEAPTQTGTTALWLYAQPVDSGPQPFVGTWGPITGARPYRIRLVDTWSPTWLHFLKPGHDSDDCSDPDAVITVPDGGELDAEDIATLQGGTPPLGVQLTWVACRTSQAGDYPSSVTVNLDWEKP